MSNRSACGKPVRSGLPPRHPPIARVYHVAEADNWPSIRKRGLLSALALLELPGVTEADRQRVMCHRPVRTVLSNGIVVRDQGPMPPAALQGCLRGMTADEWYTLLNGKVFFWADAARVARHLHACRRHPQVVLTFDADRLLARHATTAAVSPFNTGNARRRPAQRGRETFVPFASWRDSGWQHEASAPDARVRPRSHQPAELTIERSVPDAMDFVIDIRFAAPGAGIAL